MISCSSEKDLGILLGVLHSDKAEDMMIKIPGTRLPKLPCGQKYGEGSH
jgi:hypothetical protein